MWECGLKLKRNAISPHTCSHSLCGSVDWNLNEMPYLRIHASHSLCGSVDWNLSNPADTQPWLGHSLCGSVDWNSTSSCFLAIANMSLLMWECGLKHYRYGLFSRNLGHSLCGSVDWNIHDLDRIMLALSHSLCGSVDWNDFVDYSQINDEVTPYVGVWIETCPANPVSVTRQSLLMWECGLKLTVRDENVATDKSLLMWECGLKLPRTER